MNLLDSRREIFSRWRQICHRYQYYNVYVRATLIRWFDITCYMKPTADMMDLHASQSRWSDESCISCKTRPVQQILVLSA